MPLTLPDRLSPGLPYPIGAHWDGIGINFALFSAHATAVDLCLFSSNGRKELCRLPLPECTDEIWHGYLPTGEPGLLYGYRVHGPYEPAQGHRFNANKLLLDPYARQLGGPLRWGDGLFGYRLQSSRADLSYDRRDSAPMMPKGVVVDDSFHWGNDQPPATPWAETVIYEAHLKGLSMLREDLLPHVRGTFAALADSRLIEHLHRLGITAIELLPIHAFLQDRVLLERGLRNYWGYNTLSYFAPEPMYLSGNQRNELKVAIRRLHAAGIEVLLDVVYNHTCEGNELGPTLSWRGIDNASYYRLMPDDARYYINDTGCGNTLNTAHPRVLQMVLDSLRYWVEVFHIDGFRFDLGSTLGREPHGFDPGSGFFDALLQDPVLSRVKLISEPWDLGPGGYQVGRHPPGFAEWNDQFRDTARRFWRGDDQQRGGLAARLAGSADLFDYRHRKPWASINFITAHDGFTLADLVSYASKHNEANGEDNRDGNDDNASANWSPNGEVEGPTDDSAISTTRGRVQRALFATLCLAHGTPMLTAGDEWGRSQQGNNNAYCQDGPLSWLNWAEASSDSGRTLSDYVAHLLALRSHLQAYAEPRFAHGHVQVAEGLSDIGWFDWHGPLSDEQWADPTGRTLMMRRAARTSDDTLQVTLLLMNASGDTVDFLLPEPAAAWCVLIDSDWYGTQTNAAERRGAAAFGSSGLEPSRLPRIDNQHYMLAPHSVALLLAEPAQDTDQPQEKQ